MARTTTPSPGNRTPVPVKTGRGPGDILRALGAFLALAVLVAGVPLSLAYFIGWPLPSSMPGLDALRQEIGTEVFINVLAVLVWVAWAQFTACVLVEIRAAVSGVGLPRRVPGAGPSQLLARQLVGALLLLGSTAAGFAPGLGQLGAAFHQPPAVVAEAAQEDGGTGQDGSVLRADRNTGGEGTAAEAAEAAETADSAGAADTAEATKYYRIQPPEGRHHDTLWGISERHLGDGLRYKEIYQLNKDRVQPDGSRLTEASLIRPGWILEMPADAEGGELVQMPDDLVELTEDEVAELEEYRGTGDTEWPDPEPAGDAGGDTGGEEDAGTGHADLTRPEGEEPADGTVPAYDTEPAEDTEAPAGSAFGLSDALMGAPLLAAGLLAALGRSRRQALWQSAAGVLAGRGVGDGLEPEGNAADARDALLIGADPSAVAFLDGALRRLSAALDDEGRTLPAVYAAWLGEDELHLQLAAPAGRPPAPWQPGSGDTYWTLSRSQLTGRTGPEDAEAPYPGLVSLGMRDGMRLLLNLEAVPGIVTVAGAARDRDAVLSSIAAELATSGWSDRMTVTLVGFGADLTALAPTRVRHLEDTAALLEVMETETALRRGALEHAGQDSVLTGRTGPARRRQWAPHLVVVGSPLAEDEAERLAGLAAVSAPLGIGYLVSSGGTGLPGVAWEFEVTGDGLLKEPDMDLELTAQLLPAAQRAAVVELFAEVTREPGDNGEITGPAFRVDLTERGKPEVYVRMMGGYEITGLPEPGSERAGQLREALALLLLHRRGVHPRVLGSALWPRGGPEDVRDALIARLREWLGRDAGGAQRLVTGEDGRLTLSPRVVSDWDVLCTLHHRAVHEARGVPAAERVRQLTDALALARGPLLEGCRAEGRFGWLDHEIVDAQYPLLVAETALTLSSAQLAAGEGEKAYTAIRSALAAAPADERLWNELLRSAQATGRPEWLSGAATWLVAHHHGLYGDQPLPAQTEALLDELLPQWRTVTTVG
ncbi:BTAD domain-containing putative transcriptional regulator [Streptomyces sodiiphilus]|uniref:BTAD domain-containing putative transcriptional regulator n=1 Tax=Streptomyces sodiiphilus TaxID=226217 RepID=A0ABN2NVC0_9ACTN